MDRIQNVREQKAMLDHSFLDGGVLLTRLDVLDWNMGVPEVPVRKLQVVLDGEVTWSPFEVVSGTVTLITVEVDDRYEVQSCGLGQEGSSN